MKILLINLFCLISFVFFTSNSFALPPCRSSASSFNFCYGSSALDQGKYVGEWKDNMPHGQGTLYYKTGDTYKGGWKNGTFEGQGTYTSVEDGYVLTGIFKNNVLTKQISLTSDDSEFEANFVKEGNSNNKKCGIEDKEHLNCFGKYKFPKGPYIGFIKNGVPNGLGIYKIPGKGIYYANYKGGLPDGKGLFYIYSKNETRSYTFKSGRVVGKGKFMHKGKPNGFLNAKTYTPNTKSKFRKKSTNANSNFEELKQSYVLYQTIRECNSQNTMYINNSQMKNAKTKIKNIQNYFAKKYKNINTDNVWNSAQNQWDNDIGKKLKVFGMLGQYNDQLKGICTMTLLSLNAVSTPNASNKSRKKDF